MTDGLERRLFDRFAAVVARLEPSARLTAARPFAGGLSSVMTVLELDARSPSPAAVRRLVVRQPRPSRLERRSLPLADEFALLVSLHDRGLPVPRPRLYDDSGAVFDDPYAVFDYVDGSPRATTADPVATGGVFADQLAAVHAVAGTDAVCTRLPQRTAAVAASLATAPAAPDAALGEEVLRRHLTDRWPPPPVADPVLLHGDFWAGNLLWRDDAVVAVIDWEEAATGDRLTDVATTRLDILWAFGPVAMEAFTDRYLSVTAVDRAAAADRLALWDLAAALRCAGALSAWAADWSDFGRPDIDAAALRSAQRWFADRALAALGRHRHGT